jgi:5-hydroxyisourate hydrolase
MAEMSISIHVVDCMNGCAAADMAVRICHESGQGWQELDRGRTDARGTLVLQPTAKGIHQIECNLDAYFAGLGSTPFYPRIRIEFRVTDGSAPYDIRLLITPHGYGTYRGGHD